LAEQIFGKEEVLSCKFLQSHPYILKEFESCNVSLLSRFRAVIEIFIFLFSASNERIPLVDKTLRSSNHHVEWLHANKRSNQVLEECHQKPVANEFASAQ